MKTKPKFKKPPKSTSKFHCEAGENIDNTPISSIPTWSNRIKGLTTLNHLADLSHASVRPVKLFLIVQPDILFYFLIWSAKEFLF